MVSVFGVIKFLYFKWLFNDRMTVIKLIVIMIWLRLICVLIIEFDLRFAFIIYIVK